MVVSLCDTALLIHYNNITMQEVYVVEDHEDMFNVYVMGVFSSRRNAEAFIEKVEEKMNETLFEIKVVEYKVDFEDMEGY